MASFDVTSLFTNIPLDETIKIIADQLFSNSNNFEGFSRDEFVKLVWAIIFLTKLRFLPGISIATVLKDRYFRFICCLLC